MDEQLQQQIVLLVQAAMSGDEKATLQIQQIMQAAENGDQQATLLAQLIQQVVQQMQELQTQMAKLGAKLNYINLLRGKCPEGYEMKYHKVGGSLVKQCTKCAQAHKKHDSLPKNAVDSFRCGRKMKKTKK